MTKKIETIKLGEFEINGKLEYEGVYFNSYDVSVSKSGVAIFQFKNSLRFKKTLTEGLINLEIDSETHEKSQKSDLNILVEDIKKSKAVIKAYADVEDNNKPTEVRIFETSYYDKCFDLFSALIIKLKANVEHSSSGKELDGTVARLLADRNSLQKS